MRDSEGKIPEEITLLELRLVREKIVQINTDKRG
jgi:hypothetical protein